MKTDIIIKKHLIEMSLPNLAEGKLWRLFKKSDWYKWSVEDVLKCEEIRTKHNIESYGQRFLSSARHLNLI